ncbi:hypothetical protein [Clostridium butyricum]|uniref:hypothetical protein n=1 Tax=Clostridium butyricum TaxID=1492 RepID=UPI002ABE54E7|nr:hypothetical protein [Clostridium butyricum]
MINISTVRDMLVVVTTLITILSAIIKIANNFFLDVIKTRFSEVPGKQPMVSTIIKTMALLVYLINCMILLFYIITSKSEIDKQISSIVNIFTEGNFVSSCTFIMYIIFFLIGISTVRNFSYLDKKLNEMVFDKEFLCESKFVKYTNIFNICMSLIFSSVSILGVSIIIVSSFTQTLNFSNYEAILYLAVILIFSLGITIVSISFNPIMNLLEKKQYYYIRISNEVIVCRFYLEYKNYYLVIEDNTERFIKISEVKEIKIKYEK